LIAAQYAGISIDVPAFEFAKDNETADYKAKFPTQKVPALDTPNGPIFESNAMARYVAGVRADSGLLGASHYESGQVDQWIFWATNELDAPVGCIVYPILGYMQSNPKTAQKAREDLLYALSLLNSHLETRTFLVGNRVTLADISLSCSLLWAFKLYLDPATRAAVPNVERWFLTCVNQPQFAAVMGEVALCTAAPAGAAAKPKEEKKKEEKKAEAKPAAAAEAKPKEDKKKKKDDDEEEEDPSLKEEKPRLSPEEEAWISRKSEMDMDNVKRLFSNNKYQDVAAEFWAKFDHSTYTVWEATYNYQDDNTIDWKTCNYVGGVLQRLEESRKVSYGVFTVSGDTKPFFVNALFLFKYKEVPTFVKDSADYDCFTYKQVDITTDAGKARMEMFWSSETVDGKTVKDRRFLK